MHGCSATAPLTTIHLRRRSQDEQKFAQWFKVLINKLSGIPNAGGNGNAESSRGQALAMEGTREEELNSLIV